MSWEEISSDVAKAISKIEAMEREAGEPLDPRYMLTEQIFPELSAFAASLKEFQNGYPCAWSGQGGHSITPGTVVAGILRCIRAGHALQAIADAYHHAFHGTNHASHYSTPLYGVEFQGIHDLSKKVRLRTHE